MDLISSPKPLSKSNHFTRIYDTENTRRVTAELFGTFASEITGTIAANDMPLS